MASLRHLRSSVCLKSDILTDDATSEYESDSEWKALMYCVCNAAITLLRFELIAQYYDTYFCH